jgi:hypothetical protein
MASRRRWPLALTALVVAALGAGVLEQAFALHTDDGCEVETHCLSCRLTLGSASLSVTPPSVLERTADAAEAVWVAEESLRAQSVPAALPPRGPPATS